MSGLLTKEFKYLVCKHTHSHIVAWRAMRDKAGKQWGRIETAFDQGELSWLGWDPDDGYDRFENVFDLWFIAKLKVAQLISDVPAKALWGHFKVAPALYDAELDRRMPFAQFQFLCRHMSFAHTGPLTSRMTMSRVAHQTTVSLTTARTVRPRVVMMLRKTFLLGMTPGTATETVETAKLAPTKALGLRIRRTVPM